MHVSHIVGPDAETVDRRHANAKQLMKQICGAKISSMADDVRGDFAAFGSGYDETIFAALYRAVPMVQTFDTFLSVCHAVAKHALTADPSGGVEVIDPLDGSRFAWNPPMTPKRGEPVGSGDFTGAGRPGARAHAEARQPNRARRVQMPDSAYAAIVVQMLHDRDIRDVVAVHDAFLVPADRHAELHGVMTAAGRAWLPKLGGVFDLFERYLPESATYAPSRTKARPRPRRLAVGSIVREWRHRWEQRLDDCRAARSSGPTSA